eukprot:4681970-Prymnesium_polylepis.1
MSCCASSSWPVTGALHVLVLGAGALVTSPAGATGGIATEVGGDGAEGGRCRTANGPSAAASVRASSARAMSRWRRSSSRRSAGARAPKRVPIS